MIETAFRALRLLDAEGRARGVAYLADQLGVAEHENEPSFPEVRRRTRAEDVIAAVAQAAGITVEQVVSPSRQAELVQVRNAAALALRRTGLSSPAIGRALGGRDHTTILHALKSANAAYAESEYFRQLVEAA